MREMAKEEFAELQKEKADLEERLKLLLVPKDPNDDKKRYFRNPWSSWRR